MGILLSYFLPIFNWHASIAMGSIYRNIGSLSADGASIVKDVDEKSDVSCSDILSVKSSLE